LKNSKQCKFSKFEKSFSKHYDVFKLPILLREFENSRKGMRGKGEYWRG
jgi:hypothetical protein